MCYRIVVNSSKIDYESYMVFLTINNLHWLKVKKCKIDESLIKFRELGKGELGAISLAKSLKAEILLLDDSSGRHIASKIYLLNSRGTIYTQPTK